MDLKLKAVFLFLVILLLTPGAKAQSVTSYASGYFKTNYAFMVSGGDWKSVNIPDSFFLIHHPSQGFILFDTGLGKDFIKQKNSWWIHRLTDLFLPTTFNPEQDPAAIQLERAGIHPEEIKYIIISHLHYDHAGGLKDFPKAKIIVNRKEWAQAEGGRWTAQSHGVWQEQLKGLEGRLQLVDDTQGIPFENFEKTIDLFGDGTLVLISTPGHTPGHQSLLVRLPQSQPVFLTGDAAWVMENVMTPAPKSWLVQHMEENSLPAWESLKKIHVFAKRHPDVKIITGHNPEN